MDTTVHRNICKRNICKRNMARTLLTHQNMSPNLGYRVLDGHCTFTENGVALRAVDECQHCGSCHSEPTAAKAPAAIDTRTPMQRLASTLRAPTADEGAEQ